MTRQQSYHYYAFGSFMGGRQYNSTSYRFGFNGKEKDDEVKGAGNQIAFEARIYDARLGRWLSKEPLQNNFASVTPYLGNGNNPMIFKDVDGNLISYILTKNSDGTYNLDIKVSGIIVNESNEQSNSIEAFYSNMKTKTAQTFNKSFRNNNLNAQVNVRVSLDFRFGKETDIKQDDHVIGFVNANSIASRTEINGDGVAVKYDPIGIADLEGNIMFLEVGYIHSFVMQHEMGHWLGLKDEYLKKKAEQLPSGNLMQGGGYGNSLSGGQIQDMFHRYTNGTVGKNYSFRNANFDVLGSGNSKNDYSSAKRHPDWLKGGGSSNKTERCSDCGDNVPNTSDNQS